MGYGGEGRADFCSQGAKGLEQGRNTPEHPGLKLGRAEPPSQTPSQIIRRQKWKWGLKWPFLEPCRAPEGEKRDRKGRRGREETDASVISPRQPERAVREPCFVHQNMEAQRGARPGWAWESYSPVARAVTKSEAGGS